jgi:glycine/D-amino acid oxidase-like deaminating enzyme
MATSAPSTGLDQARPIPYWIDTAPAPARRPRLTGDVDVDLLIIGGGYTGLWTAILAKEENPDSRVAILEAQHCGHAASGRNGGFCSPSLTHGLWNGLERWPDEIDTLVRLGLENLREIEATINRYDIDADFSMTGKISVARHEWEATSLQGAARVSTAHGDPATFIPPAELGSWMSSTPYVAGMHSPNFALVNPYKLALGLRRVCIELGVQLYEDSAVDKIDSRNPAAVTARTAHGTVRATRVALATNAYQPLLRRLSLLTIPVYDYAIVSEPLNEDQFSSVGWHGDYGFTDSGNQFHYCRKTPDGRILWGGYDAVYYCGSARDDARTQRPATFEKLALQFRETFPPLSDVAFTHQWGGLIDSSTRFCITAGTAARGRIAYALGFTGLGVTATRFGGQVMLDLLAGRTTERTNLAMIRRGSMPFPPEPIRYVGVQLTRWSMARQDRTGRQNLWLRLLDVMGVGFDS